MRRFERENQPNPTGELDITTGDISRTISSTGAFRIRIIATAGDPESKIKSIAIDDSSLSWRCGGNSNTQTEALTFSPTITPPTSPATPMQINIVATPSAQIRQSCNNIPIQVHGHVRLVVTNGAGLQTKSGTFLFTYPDR